MGTREWHPEVSELKVRMFVNYKLFGIFVRSVAETIIKGMCNVKEVDFMANGSDNYCFVSTSED